MPHLIKSMIRDGKVKKQKQQVPNLPKDKAKGLTKGQLRMLKAKMHQEKQQWPAACKVLIILSRVPLSTMKAEKILNANQLLTKLPENPKMSNLQPGLVKRAKISLSTIQNKPTPSSKRKTKNPNSSLSPPILLQLTSNISSKSINSKKELPPVVPKV